MIYRIISKLHFIKKLPRRVAKPTLFAIIAFEDFFWKFRLFIFTLIFGKGNKIGKALIDLKKNGVAIIPKFYSDNKVVKIKEECIKQLDKLPFEKLNTDKYISNLVLENELRVEKLKGSIKLKGLHKVNIFFKEIGRDFVSNLITLIYQLSFSKPFLIYNLVHNGSFNHPAVPDPCGTDLIASQPHIDGYTHHLRCCLILDDIEKENGPTVLYKSSMHLSEFKSNYLNQALEEFKFSTDKGGSHNLNEEKIKILREKTDKIYATGNKGDLVLIDSKTAHHASVLKSGARHLLWIYY